MHNYRHPEWVPWNTLPVDKTVKPYSAQPLQMGRDGIRSLTAAIWQAGSVHHFGTSIWNKYGMPHNTQGSRKLWDLSHFLI